MVNTCLDKRSKEMVLHFLYGTYGYATYENTKRLWFDDC